MSEPSAEQRSLIEQAYRAFNARNVDSALELMTPDVAWPNGMEGGPVHGRDGVREYWTRQWMLIDPSVQPLRIEVEADGRLNVTVHQVVKDLDGYQLSARMLQHVYTVREGQVAAMEIREA